MNRDTKKFLINNSIYIIAGLAALLLVIYFIGQSAPTNTSDIVVTEPTTNVADVVEVESEQPIAEVPTPKPVPVAGDGLAYTTTDSGLQYRAISTVEGDQPSPSATDRVEVYYHGTLEDGTVFDSAYDRGESITFGLNQVIRGWTEGLQYMQEGDVFEFSIPADLAYGQQGRPGIPGGATLNFTVELVNVR